MSEPLRFVFMGSDPIALPFLENLWKDAPVRLQWCGVFTQPDRPTGRGMRLRANEIKHWAEEKGIPVLQPEKCGEADAAWLQEQKVDLVLVMAYGQILRRSFLQAPARGVYNLHASLLPKLRGASPIHTAIASGEKWTGVSLMRIVPKLDAGPVCDAEPVAISNDMQAPDLIAEMAQACVPLVRRNLPLLASGEARFTDQDEQLVTYCRIIQREDARLDFSASVQELHDRIRAFQPWPGAVFSGPDGDLKVGAARPAQLDQSLAPPGTIYVSDSRQLYVACGDGWLELLQLQRPGGRMLPADAFLLGFSFPRGFTAPSHAMKALVENKRQGSD